MSKITIALCGNPNSGKTTLFNRLTGSNQKIGNWAGVTVERKQGFYKNDVNTVIVDTPGAYSLTPYSTDEQIAVDYLTKEKPDLIINVVDSTNLERNLLLTTQLMDLGVPLVVALNFKDEAEAKGILISPVALEYQLKRKVFYISAAKNIGLDEMMDYCLRQTSWQCDCVNFSQDIAERYSKICSVANIARQVDGDEALKKNTTAAIDKFVLNKWLAFPIFFTVMTAIFYISVGSVGKWLTSLIESYLTPLLQTCATNLLASANSPLLTSLVNDGIIAGVMSVVGFVPQIMLLFGCIAILEASGYMSRIAFITDRALSKIGLGGRSFVSMILGCGCSTPAIMSARTIKNIDERNVTITLTPFVPCSAKLAVISFFTAKFFDGNALYAISFYAISIAVIILGGLFLKILNRNKNCNSDAFIMELPSYRLPTAANVLKQMWERGKAFIIKAGTVIFASSVVLWVLQSFNVRFEHVSAEQSLLSNLGKLIAPIFTPLGFNDGNCGWQFSVATLTGIVAKETVVTTLEILLPKGIENCISNWGAYCFVVYNLLTAPCIATISASFSELGEFRKGLKTLTFQVITAYIVTLVMYQVGMQFINHTQTATIVAVIVAVSIALIFATAYAVKHGKCNGDCKHCTLKH